LAGSVFEKIKTVRLIIVSLLLFSIAINMYKNIYDYNSAKVTIYSIFLENVIFYIFTGSGLFLFIKIYAFTHYKELISEGMYILDYKLIENHRIYKSIDNIINHVYSLGSVSNKIGRVKLFLEIINLEQLHLKVFISNTIHSITNDKYRNNPEYIVNSFQKSFDEYNSELIELLKYSCFPQTIIERYVNFKKTYSNTFIEYLNGIDTSSLGLPANVILLCIIDSLTVLTVKFLKDLHYEIDHLNGELKGQLFRGYLL
jgi:hypothetical protein